MCFFSFFFFFFYKIVSVVSAFSYCLDDTLPFVKISLRILLTENFWEQVSCSPATLLNSKSPKQQFSSCVCGKQHRKAACLWSQLCLLLHTKVQWKLCLGLHIGLDCARSNTPKLGCCHYFFFFRLCNSALMNSDLQCSMCCMCTESFTFAYVRKWKSLRCVQLFANRLSRPKYWSEQPCVSPGDLPNPGIESRSLALQADSLPAEPPGKPCCCC